MNSTKSDRLRFAVINFRQMQGLRQAVLGAFIAVVCGPLFLENSFGLKLTAVLVIPGLIGLYFAWTAIERYYARRVGHIEQQPPGTMRSILTIFFTSVGPFLIHPGSLQSMAAYMKGFSPAWWIGCTYLGLIVMTRRRWYYLPFALLFLLLGVWRSSTSDIEVMGRIDVLFLAMLPVSMIITGILDHFYLLNSFARSGENRDA
jgi:small neutral amino acid transporter SnatA (MarC family)